MRFGARIGWGLLGGLMPSLLRFVQAGLSDVHRNLPTEVGTFYVAAVAASLVLGAVASVILESNHPITGVYNGATAPIALAFLAGLNPYTLQ